MPPSPQPHRREAPALARAVTPARPTPTVCRAALSASAAVSPARSTRLYTNPPVTVGRTGAVQSFTFPEIAGGGAISYGSGPCTVFLPYNVGRIFISAADFVKFLTKSHMIHGPSPSTRARAISAALASTAN